MSKKKKTVKRTDGGEVGFLKTPVDESLANVMRHWPNSRQDKERLDWETSTSLAFHLVNKFRSELAKGLGYSTLFKRECARERGTGGPLYTVNGGRANPESLRECYRKAKRKK